MSEATDYNAGTVIVETKLTAAQIEENCPVALQNLGKQIAVQYEKAQKYEDKASQNYTTVAQLLATANEACDEGGFNTFREMFFPNLGKSRVYELLAIGTGKKSVEEARASNRERQAKHRANKAEALNSVTVTESAAPRDALTDVGGTDTTYSAAAPTKRCIRDLKASISFNAAVRELVRLTGNEKAERFAKTSATADDLERLGKFLIAIANFKKSHADKPAPITALPDNGEVSAPEQSPEIMKVERHARNAEEVRP